MIVIAIIAFLATVSYTMYNQSGKKANYAQVQACFAEAALRLENYRSNYGRYPAANHFDAIGIDNKCGENYEGTIEVDGTGQRYIVYYEDSVSAIYGDTAGQDGWAVVNGSNDIYHYKNPFGNKYDTLPTGYGTATDPGF